MSRSPSPSFSTESYYSYSEESEGESFPEKPLLEIGGYHDSVEPPPTEEEAPEYLEQLPLAEGKEQILLFFFFWGGRHWRLVCLPCYEIQKFSQYEWRE